jgi:hypothetical protein
MRFSIVTSVPFARRTIRQHPPLTTLGVVRATVTGKKWVGRRLADIKERLPHGGCAPSSGVQANRGTVCYGRRAIGKMPTVGNLPSLEIDASAPTVQRISGHKTLAVVLRFTHVDGPRDSAHLSGRARAHGYTGITRERPRRPSSYSRPIAK